MRKIVPGMKRMRLKIFLSIFITYLMISLAVGIVFSFAIYRSYSIILDDARQLGQSKLDLITSQIANEIANYVKFCDLLAANSQIKNYATLQQDETIDLAMGAYYLQKDFAYLGSNVNINNLAIYFPRNHSIVTMTRRYDFNNIDWFFDDYKGLAEDQLMTFSEGLYGMHAMGNGHNWITRKIFIGNQSAAALIIIDYNLEGIINEIIAENEVVLIGDQDSLIYTNTTGITDEQYSRNMAAAKSGQLFDYSGETFIAAYSDASILQWEIVVGIPQSNINSGIEEFRLFTMVVLVVGIIMIALLSLVLSKQTYTPLDNLIHVMSDNHGSDTFTKAMNTAKQNLLQLKGENEDFKMEMNHVAPIILGKMLLQLLEKRDNSSQNIAQYCLSIAGLKPDDQYLLFAIHYMEDANNFFSDETNDVLQDKRLGLPYFMLDNLFSDLIFHEMAGSLAPVGDYYVVFTTYKSEKDLEYVNNAISHVTRFYQDSLGVTLSVTRPLVGQSAAELRDVFSQLSKEIAYLMFWKDEAHQEQQNDDAKFSSYFKYIRILINCLDAQNYQAAYKTVENILENGLPKGEKNLRSAIYRIYGMIGMIVSAIDEHTEQDKAFIENLNYEERLNNVKNITSFKNETQNILSELILYKQKNQEVMPPRLVEEIEQYISSHFTESDISVSSIATHFSITESYLSRLMKIHMKSNCLEYVQKLRVAKAKEYLKTHSISDTAQKVGFWDAQALIRAFKKYEGITPGSYKRTMNSEDV